MKVCNNASVTNAESLLPRFGVFTKGIGIAQHVTLGFLNGVCALNVETTHDCRKTNLMQYVVVAKQISLVSVVEKRILPSEKSPLMVLFVRLVCLIFTSPSHVVYAVSQAFFYRA
ncbi:hypothetical protein [Methylobacter sp. YRD-M1]|uniref:hypothetical protein n=1 Tax=Methylobacter sp. YRD-M1 TaxID=2911520 RepID=UPI00227B3ABD|nr:hypothetical protein [Methylobacter sp. YRD-M1]WAK04467.1 hypothetical protein LZ558_21015 [Methylobacter sp. YRD-M1]